MLSNTPVPERSNLPVPAATRAHLPGKERRGPGPSPRWSAGPRRRHGCCCWPSPPAWRQSVAKVSDHLPALCYPGRCREEPERGWAAAELLRLSAPVPPGMNDCSAALLLVGERGRTGFGDSSSHGDRAFVPTGISPDSSTVFRLEPGERGSPAWVCSFLLAEAGRSSTLLPAQLSTCSVGPAREI